MENIMVSLHEEKPAHDNIYGEITYYEKEWVSLDKWELSAALLV